MSVIQVNKLRKQFCILKSQKCLHISYFLILYICIKRSRKRRYQFIAMSNITNMYMKKTKLFVFILIILAFTFILASCTGTGETKDPDKTESTDILKDQCIISLDPNGGSVSTTGLLVKKGTKASLPEPTKDGSEFLGWFDESGKEVNNKTVINDSMVLTAKWSAYKVTFYDLAGNVFKTENVSSGAKVSVPSETPASYQGKSFTSWDFDFNKTIVHDENIYPEYSMKTVELKLHAKGGSGVDEVINVVLGSSAELPRPVKTGKVFLGWFDAEGNKFENGTVITGELELYAGWNAYDVYYLTNTGSIFKQLTVASGEKATDIDVYPVEESCKKFVGWSFDFDKAIYDDQYIMPLYSSTEYEHKFAKWVIISDSDYEHKGVRSRMCNNCGFVESESIPVKDYLEFTLHKDAGSYYTVKGNVDSINKDKVEKLIIPNKYSNLPVLGIEEYAFEGVNCVKEVEISNGITSIEKHAFRNVPIEKLTLPNTVKVIGERAFENTLITKLEIPASTEILGEYCFANNAMLYDIVIGDMHGEIKEGAFADCVYVHTLKLHKNIKEIFRCAFKGMYNLLDVYFVGTQADFDNITIDIDDNNYLIENNKIFVKS